MLLVRSIHGDKSKRASFASPGMTIMEKAEVVPALA